jgi:hypothetical protein
MVWCLYSICFKVAVKRTPRPACNEVVPVPGTITLSVGNEFQQQSTGELPF